MIGFKRAVHHRPGGLIVLADIGFQLSLKDCPDVTMIRVCKRRYARTVNGKR